MLITKEIVFIHIPKTAGRSVITAYCESFDVPFNKHGISGYANTKAHQFASEVHWVMGSDYDKAFRFAIVRNPFDRLVSFYHYGQANFKYKFEDFEDFVEFVCADKYRPEAGEDWHTAKITQSEYLDDHIDLIATFEDLDYYWTVIQKRTGITSELPLVNASERQHYSHYYNDELKLLVFSQFLVDFTRFYPETLCEL